MATASDNIQKLIEQARADSQGPRRVQSTYVFNNNGTLYGAIDPTFASNIGLSGGERIEKYVSEDGRAMVMLFPESDDDE
jgi:hypothetical protein